MLNRAIDQLPKRLMMVFMVKGAHVKFVWTNHGCKRSLLFRCVSSENSLKHALSVIVSVISGMANIYAN